MDMIFNPRKHTFDPEKHIPDLTGKVFVVTGGTSGMGSDVIQVLAKYKPMRIIFMGRDENRGDRLVAELEPEYQSTQFHFFHCDHESLGAVERTANTILRYIHRLDALICNAAVMTEEHWMTDDQYEYNFGVNCMAHALLIKMFLPLLKTTSAIYGAGCEARIVNVACPGRECAIKLGQLKYAPNAIPVLSDFHYHVCLGRTKLASLLCTKKLAEDNPDITCVSVQPGDLRKEGLEHGSTELRTPKTACGLQATEKFLIAKELKNLKKLMYNSLWAATTSSANIRTGALYKPVGRRQRSVTSPSLCLPDLNKGQLKIALWNYILLELEDFESGPGGDPSSWWSSKPRRR